MVYKEQCALVFPGSTNNIVSPASNVHWGRRNVSASSSWQSLPTCREPPCVDYGSITLHIR